MSVLSSATEANLRESNLYTLTASANMVNFFRMFSQTSRLLLILTILKSREHPELELLRILAIQITGRFVLLSQIRQQVSELSMV